MKQVREKERNEKNEKFEKLIVKQRAILVEFAELEWLSMSDNSSGCGHPSRRARILSFRVVAADEGAQWDNFIAIEPSG
jgi:hypothetical protein